MFFVIVQLLFKIVVFSSIAKWTMSANWILILFIDVVLRYYFFFCRIWTKYKTVYATLLGIKRVRIVQRLSWKSNAHASIGVNIQIRSYSNSRARNRIRVANYFEFETVRWVQNKNGIVMLSMTILFRQIFYCGRSPVKKVTKFNKEIFVDKIGTWICQFWFELKGQCSTCTS